jgi:hypothetical protein
MMIMRMGGKALFGLDVRSFAQFDRSVDRLDISLYHVVIRQESSLC